MKYKIKYDLTHITSLDSLHKEQSMVRERIANREDELKAKMYEIPAELAAAGVNSFIPKILRGKVTNAAINGGKRLLNSLIVPETQQQSNFLAISVKNRGIFAAIKKGIKIFRGK